MNEARHTTSRHDGKDTTTEERVSRLDPDGKLSEISHTVSKDSETAPGENKSTTETYSLDVPGNARDGSMHLVERSTTTQHKSPSGQKSAQHQVEQPDPGNPDVCPVGDLHKIFSSKETMAKVNEGCRSAGIGCIECKGWAADALVQLLAPIQEKRRKYEERPRDAWDILETGAEDARKAADETMKTVRASMGMSLDYEPPKVNTDKAPNS